MIKTRITEALNIQYPIMQGGMRYFGTPELAAAVSNAGGLGTLTAGNYRSIEELRKAVRQVKSLTDKPFCVNISLVPNLVPPELAPLYFETLIEENVLVIETAGNNPAEFMPMIKDAGIKLIHKVPSLKFARKAEEFGADIVTVIGVEAAGRPSPDEITTMVLGNKAAHAINIPIFLAGGIANGAGLIAVLALGGDGVVMGTRFLATHECSIHPNFKEWLLKAKETDTVIIQRSIKNMMRVMKNDTALKVLDMEKQGASREELLAINSTQLGRKCLLEGNVMGGILAVGQAVGLIDRIKTVKEVIDETMTEAQMIMSRLNEMVQLS